MTVNVQLFGSLLYCVSVVDGKKLLQQVLVPDAEFGSPRDGKCNLQGQPCHFDHSIATKHYARMALYKPNVDLPYRVISIAYSEVKIGSGALLNASKIVQNVAALGTVKKGEHLTADESEASARIVLHAPGVITTTYSETGKFKFGKDEVHNVVNVAYHDAVRVEIKRAVGRTLVVNVPRGHVIALYNFDRAIATLRELLSVVPPERDYVDDDFKWLYTLVAPPKGKKFAAWAGDAPLPAPVFKMKVKVQVNLAVSVSTCFPGWV